ncbi:helix-turn-helix transcriptional regulator [Streptomyces sp. SP2-10]|uniref:helix-turn-helix domain-containing protein n=1 Tax=Streptomyces sp. SP2-10 TaxID=2873385 RepID=UPI001CA64F29|nr:helix-turn-helix transcriptional regulator [Streptomyces sp. SP2-10]MBY8846077.1 helix-turn-helix domain-containing protein [Streptomyces sp. SP2-10]
MPADADASKADDFSGIIASIDQLLSTLGMCHEDLDLEEISYQTAIPVDRVRSLLAGAEAEPEDLHDTFKQRLIFLRETRLKPDGKRYTLDEIAAGTGVSHGQVGYLLNGERRPGFTVLASLEQFFNVSPGFFTATERQALSRALQPVHESLMHLALLKGKGVSHLALRSSITQGASSSRLGLELRAALAAAISQPEPEDPEVRELTNTMLSLPTKSRRQILPLIKDMLGLVRPGDAPPDDDPATS